MRRGSWISIGLIYLYGILAMVSLGKMVPLVGDISQSFGVTPKLVGVAIGMVFLVAAFFSAFGGWLIDRTSARIALALSSVAIALANALAFVAPNIVWLDIARLIEGIGNVGIVTGGAALIMGTTAGSRRITALALWSTQIPAGYALGLLIAAPFAGTPHWRFVFAEHGLFAGLMLVASIFLPSLETSVARGPTPGIFSVFRQIGAWRLGAGYGVSVIVGVGASSVVPIYFSAAHHMPVALSSRLLAIANLTNIPGGLLAGFMLTRGVTALQLSWVLAVLGALTGALTFAPAAPPSVAVLSLMLFSAVMSGTIALVNALLLRVTRGVENSAATTGFVHQIASFCGFAAPVLFLSAYEARVWTNFALLIASGLALMAAFLPTWGSQTLTPEMRLAASPSERSSEDVAID